MKFAITIALVQLLFGYISALSLDQYFYLNSGCKTDLNFLRSYSIEIDNSEETEALQTYVDTYNEVSDNPTSLEEVKDECRDEINSARATLAIFIAIILVVTIFIPIIICCCCCCAIC